MQCLCGGMMVFLSFCKSSFNLEPVRLVKNEKSMN